LGQSRPVTGLLYLLLAKDKFGLRRGREIRDAIWMLQIISEQTLNIDEEVCACFVGWQKAFHHVNWSKLIQILE